MKAAMIIYAQKASSIAAIEEQQYNNQNMLQMDEISSLLKFVYTSDPVLDREQWLDDLCNRFVPGG